jgi:hypothetical protein
MSALLGVHIAGGSIALLSGAAAVAARKGGPVHARAGTCFLAAMLVLGATASILALRTDAGAMGFGGLLTCYFVTTSWAAARRRDGTTGKFEIAACAVALGGAAAIVWLALSGGTTPVGPAPLFAFAGICLLAGLLDLNAILRTKLAPAQRISRHLWRMCFAFFIATGSFFLGQQDVMPRAVRGSPLLFVLAFAPFAAMAFWLVRLRLARGDFPNGKKRPGAE